ncbi:MAG: hypothetical protein C4B58_06575 [Deltaproteobacteria bacterium]|nr:MAG: hypothetical protein C4B58_06575 [Deltaproteobacteria bacterium]
MMSVEVYVLSQKNTALLYSACLHVAAQKEDFQQALKEANGFIEYLQDISVHGFLTAQGRHFRASKDKICGSTFLIFR